MRVNPPRLVHRCRIDQYAIRRRRARGKSGAPDIGEGINRSAFGQAVRDLHNGPFGIAEQQEVGATVEQNRSPDAITPVVVVGNAAQAGFDATDDNRYVSKGLPESLAIYRHGPVWALAGDIAGRVSIIIAPLFICGVVVNHGVHVAGGHAEEQVGAAEDGEGFGGLPVGLRDHADPEPLRFKHPTDHRHAETGMVYVAVARHDDDVTTVPAQLLHFFSRNGQPGCGAQAFRPELSIVIKWGRVTAHIVVPALGRRWERRGPHRSTGNARLQDYVLLWRKKDSSMAAPAGTIVARQYAPRAFA